MEQYFRHSIYLKYKRISSVLNPIIQVQKNTQQVFENFPFSRNEWVIMLLKRYLKINFTQNFDKKRL